MASGDIKDSSAQNTLRKSVPGSSSGLKHLIVSKADEEIVQNGIMAEV